MACNITQPFKELPTSYTNRFVLGYHFYYSHPDRVYSETVADDQAFNEGWNAADKFTNIKLILKETPTSYTDGWMAGYNHKHISDEIPTPVGHSPSSTHGFFAGYLALKDTAYSDGWLAGRHVFLMCALLNIQ